MRPILLNLFLFVFLLLPVSSFAQIEVEGLDIPSREEWQAKSAGPQVIKHIPGFITIHHTGTYQNLKRTTEEKLQALQEFSYSEGFLGDGTPKKPWPDVPYHFYIAADGTVAEGRELQYQGDSNTSYDLEGHALIVVEGNFQTEKVSREQYEVLEKPVLVLAKKYNVPAGEISGHKDQAETTCPGENLYKLLPRLREKVAAANFR